MDNLKNLINPQAELLRLGLDAADKHDIENALLYLDCAFLLNPQNEKAKQKLLEIYPEAIQDVIDEGRYDDALELANNALKIYKFHRDLNLLKGKIVGLQFIVRFYPDDELDFSDFWDKVKNLPGTNINLNRVVAPGFGFNGRIRPKKDDCFHLTKSIFEHTISFVNKMDPESEENFNEAILANLIKYNAPQKLVCKFKSFIKQ